MVANQSLPPTTLAAPPAGDSAPAIDWAAVEQEAAQLLSRYLQFDTSNPPGHEAAAIQFLADELRERGFVPQILTPGPERANLVVRLKGTGQARPGLCLLYSHADVAPANPADWSISPFSGQIKDGFVWGRGALDNKGLGIIFIQALTLLKQQGPPLERDLILLIAADEEANGQQGVVWLLDHHPDLIEAEYVWDEGGMGLQQATGPLYQVAVAEKLPLTVKLTARGRPGHAAVPQPDNPQDRLVRALSAIRRWRTPFRLTPPVIEMLRSLAPRQTFPWSFLFRQAHRPAVGPLLRLRLERDPIFSPLVTHTINLTMLAGGEANNVVSAQAQAVLDIRLLPDEDPAAFLTRLRSIIGDPQVTVEAEQTPVAAPSTPLASPFLQALTHVLHRLGPEGPVIPSLTPGATDSRFFRAAGMKAYGFSPMLLDEQELVRIHGLDERVSTANLRWGTQVVFETLKQL